MKYQPVASADLPILARAFRRLAAGSSLLPLDDGEIAARLLPGCPFPDPSLPGEKAAFLAADGEEIHGIAAGNTVPGDEVGYLSLLFAPDGNTGRELLGRLTEALSACNPELKKLRWIFYNPALFPWRLPGGAGREHPGMPGVPADSPLYRFLSEEGWREFVRLNVYARDLAGYAVPAPLLRRTAELAEEGLFIERWDPALHGSFGPLLDALGSDDWRRQITRNGEAEHPLPVMIAADRSPRTLRENGGLGFVCGFAGPMRRSENGRGYFAGIGVHPAYRSRGIGAALFAGLCRGLADLGADYMTLFTGAEGTAKRIYEKAGFAVARTCAGMEKIL